jgi:hypothetical protein
MYYSSLGRVKKDPKFSRGKLLKIHKKYGADYRNYVPASWIPILDKMAADYAAATGGRPYHGAGAQGDAGAPGDTGYAGDAGPVIGNAWPAFSAYCKALTGRNLAHSKVCFDAAKLAAAKTPQAKIDAVIGHPNILVAANGSKTFTCREMLEVCSDAKVRQLRGLGAAPVVKPAGKLFTIGLPVLAGLVGSKATSSLLVGAITGVAVYFAIQRNQS